MMEGIARRNLTCGRIVDRAAGRSSTGVAGTNSANVVVFQDRGACPFECCEYRNWVAKKDVITKRDMSDQSPVAFRINKGDWVEGVTGVVLTTKLGQGRVNRPVVLGAHRVKPGTLVEVLNYAGEGVYKLRFRGAVIEPGAYDDSSIDIVNEPTSIWWVNLRNKQGESGWSRKPAALEIKARVAKQKPGADHGIASVVSVPTDR